MKNLKELYEIVQGFYIELKQAERERNQEDIDSLHNDIIAIYDTINNYPTVIDGCHPKRFYELVCNPNHSYITVHMNKENNPHFAKWYMMLDDISIQNWDFSKGFITEQKRDNYILMTLNYHDGSETHYKIYETHYKIYP